MKTIYKKALMSQTTLLANNTGGGVGATDNVFYDATSGYTAICEQASADPLSNILPIIQHGDKVTSSIQYAQQEIPQILLIGKTEETIVAGSVYKVMLGAIYDKYETQKQELGNYSCVAPAAVSAATDRYNVYSALVAKINAYAGNNVTAYLAHSVAFDSGTDGGVTCSGFTTNSEATAEKVRFGSSGEQTTSNVTAKVAGIDVTSGAFTDDDAEGTIWLYDVSDVDSWLSASKTFAVTDVLTLTVTTAAVLTQGQAIVIVDDTGYFYPYDSNRTGITSAYLAGDFEDATVEVARVGQYAIGYGTRMLNDLPVWDRSGEDVVRGNPDYNFPEGDQPLAGKYYSLITLTVDRKANKDALGNMTVENQVVMELYVEQDSIANPSTNDLTRFYALIGTAIATYHS